MLVKGKCYIFQSNHGVQHSATFLGMSKGGHRYNVEMHQGRRKGQRVGLRSEAFKPTPVVIGGETL